MIKGTIINRDENLVTKGQIRYDVFKLCLLQMRQTATASQWKRVNPFPHTTTLQQTTLETYPIFFRNTL